MLKFRIARSDLSSHWSTSADGWQAGGSSVLPFRNPALESFAVTDGERTLLVNRERGTVSHATAITNVSPEELRELFEEAVAWPLDHLTLLLSRHEARLEAHAGRWGTAPLYLCERDGVLYGDWDAAALYPYLDAALDPQLAAVFLARFAQPYSRRTVIEGLMWLTTGAHATWSARESLSLHYPPAEPVPRPRPLKAEADAPAIFLGILEASMRRWLDRGPIAGAHLSGGLDSALVVATGARIVDTPLRTYGLLMTREQRDAQQRRRDELIARFELRDTAVMGEDFLPFDGDGARMRTQRVVPWEEIYQEATDRLLLAAREDGVTMMFSGIGGDELCYPHATETTKAADECGVMPSFLTASAIELLRDVPASIDCAPTAAISTSALEGFGASATRNLQFGLWPVSPLATPELVRFCRRLPREWRDDRRIARTALARLGCSTVVTHPPEVDDFSPMFDRCLITARRDFMRSLFAESRLAGLGLVDRDRLLSAYDASCAQAGKEEPEARLPFFATALLELTLRSIDARRPIAPVIAA